MISDASDSSDPPPAPPKRYRILARLESPITRLAGLTCRDFARLTVARMDRPLSLQENVRHRMHGVMCTLCRSFSGQFNDINELIREAATENIVARHEEENDVEAPAPHESDERVIDRIRSAVREQVDPTKR